MESISIREAAERLGVSHKVIRRLIAQGIVSALKAPGAHGMEWTVSAPSLEDYRSRLGDNPPRRRPSQGQPRPRQAYPAPPAQLAPGEGEPAPWREFMDSLREDKRFLQAHVAELTSLLHGATGGREPAREPARTDGFLNGEGDGQAVKGNVTEPVPEPVLAARITEALQSSLRFIGTGDIRGLEMCSVRVLWGNPVLWRVVAESQEDVAALLDAMLSPDARWDPPGEEVVFVWARDASGDIVWGTACGANWFGPAFQEALRTARVERR